MVKIGSAPGDGGKWMHAVDCQSIAAACRRRRFFSERSLRRCRRVVIMTRRQIEGRVVKFEVANCSRLLARHFRVTEGAALV